MCTTLLKVFCENIDKLFNKESQNNFSSTLIWVCHSSTEAYYIIGTLSLRIPYGGFPSAAAVSLSLSN